MRKAIREFLQQVTTPPCKMSADEIDGHLWALMSIYEESGRAADERARILRADALDLLDVYCSERQAIDPADPAKREENARHRGAMIDTQTILTGLIVEAERLGVRLSEAELQRYKGVEFGAAEFPDFVASIYSSGAEPQRQGRALQQQSEAQPLPDSLNTETARKVFGRAIAKGWMNREASGYKWLDIDGKGTSSGHLARLAYLCGKVYGYQYVKQYIGGGNVGNRVPYKALEALFNVTRLDRALQQVYSAKQPQRWRQKIDSLFDDEQAPC